MKGFKGEVTFEQLSQYIEGDFTKCSLLFNAIGGKSANDAKSIEHAGEIVANESFRLNEEIGEALSHIGRPDLTNKLLDDLIDVMFVGMNFKNLLESFEGRFTKENTDESVFFDWLRGHDSVNSVYLASKLLPTIVETLSSEFTEKRVYLAAQLVCENNMKKFTTDKDVAEKWEFPEEGCELRAKEIDGVTWYAIIRISDGKVMKHKGFQEVRLELA